eukprot:g5182.t1
MADLFGSSSSSGGGFLSNKDDGCLPSLSFQQRMIGFAVCFAIGCLISFTSTFSMLDPQRFAVLYTMGNIVSLMSTGFVWGPMRQLKAMFKPVRIVATVVYLTTLVLVLVVALAVPDFGGKTAVIIMLLICQFLALSWYALSYIPFARTAVKNCAAGCFK